jgi:hypothetical protein
VAKGRLLHVRADSSRGQIGAMMLGEIPADAP